MHALAGQRVQVDRQRGGEGFALAGAHFADLAVVQRNAAQHLHVEVAHLHDALGAFAHDGKGFGQDGVQRLAGGHAGLELLGLGAQLLVAQGFQRCFGRVDLRHGASVLLEQAIVATAENFGEDVVGHDCGVTRRTRSRGDTVGPKS